MAGAIGGRCTGTAGTHVKDGEAVVACIRLLQDRGRDEVTSVTDCRSLLLSSFVMVMIDNMEKAALIGRPRVSGTPEMVEPRHHQ